MDGVGTILPPDMPSSIPAESKWLSGQGGGTWFHIDKTDKENEYLIMRYAPSGELDCKRIFKMEKNSAVFDITQPYNFTHISHCSKCRIIQNNNTFVFNYIDN